MKTKITARDGALISPWQDTKMPVDGVAGREIICDVLIAGAGITGLTTALFLQKEGKKVVIAESRTAGFGTTGGTSAHLNTFFDTSYNDIQCNFGEDAAKLVARCGNESFSIIRNFAEKLNIDCDFEYKEAFLFAENDKEAGQLSGIYEASREAGISVSETTGSPVPVPFVKVLRFAKQGQFHPTKYLAGLIREFIAKGGILLENTPVTDVNYEEGVYTANTYKHTLRANFLVYATHIPPGINLLSFRCAPYRSYVIGTTLKDGNYLQDLAYDMQEPYHYFRTHVIDGQQILLVGGEDHKTGHEDPEKAFQNLEDYIRRYYPVDEVKYRWSSQYYVPVDGLPYIGQMPLGNSHTYIATGYNGNGIMFGTIAGKIIADQITGIPNAYGELFDPSRLKPVAGFTEFVKENADVAYHFIADRFHIKDADDGSPEMAFTSLEPGTGDVLEYAGKKLAVYKDTNGSIHAVSPVCTHAGCIVKFNMAETSWDCPCHGGRFGIDGKVLSGPPDKELEKII